MAAGDVLLFHRPITAANFRSDPFGTFMCALIHFTTRSRYNHAALDIGDGMMVEVTSKGVAVNPIRSSDEIHRIQHGLTLWDHCDPGNPLDLCYVGNDREDVLAFGTGRVGWRYGYLNAAICGLRHMWPGLTIKAANTIICSELVAESLERAGHWFGKDSALVSPGDLAEHFGVPRK